MFLHVFLTQWGGWDGPIMDPSWTHHGPIMAVRIPSFALITLRITYYVITFPISSFDEESRPIVYVSRLLIG